MSDIQSTAAESDAAPPNDSGTPDTKWWVVLDGDPAGPHSAAYIALMLGGGQCKPTTLVCEVGRTKWRAVKDVPELVGVANAQAPGSLPPPVPAAQRTSETMRGFFSRFTNPALPRFANFICAYCIVIAPCVFVALTLLTVSTGGTASYLRHESPLIVWAVTYDVLIFIADAALTLVLMSGGIMLCRLQRSGLALVRTGIILSLSWLVVGMMFWVFWEAIVFLGDQALPESNEVSGAALLLLIPAYLLSFLMFIACVVFEVTALVWLIRNEHHLALKNPIPLLSTREASP